MAVLLGTPFSADQALVEPDKLTLPIVLNPYGSTVLKIDSKESDQLRAFLKNELDVTRLNKISKHLFYAGLERPCRPLHSQILLGRDIWVCEQADLHMLWEESHIFIKPLPEFLLEYQVWQQHLCTDRSLYKNAKGFLLSYIWLVTRRSDLRIAHDKGLIPMEITWERWIGFVNQIITTIDYETLSDVNIRYHRGELRLDRINWIYRLCSKARKDGGFFRAYHYAYRTYGSFIARNLTLLTATVVYAALVLTAMQVGLAVEELKDNDSFNAASYGFAVFSILAPLIIIAAVLLVTAYLVIVNWLFTKRSTKHWTNQPIDHFSH